MRDPRPVLWLCIAHLLAVLALLGWWLGLPAPERLARLRAVQQQEQAATPPPDSLVAQAAWLFTHRRARLHGLTGLLGVAGMIGLVEGTVRRHGDPLGGMRFACWTLGVLLSALSLGAGGAVLVLPWPLPPLALARGPGRARGQCPVCVGLWTATVALGEEGETARWGDRERGKRGGICVWGWHCSCWCRSACVPCCRAPICLTRPAAWCAQTWGRPIARASCCGGAPGSTPA